MFTKPLRVLAAVLTILILTPAFAQVPNLVNFQASLNEANGDPVSGERSIQFSFYPASDAIESAFVWRETQTIQVVDGLYVAQLGSVTTFPDALFSQAELWLGVKVGTDAEQTPRIRVIAVPYALHAQRAEKAGAVDDSVIGSEQVTNESIQSEDLKDGTVVNDDLAAGSFANITGVGDLGTLTVTGLLSAGDIVSTGPVLDVRAFDGADAGAKISAAIAAAPEGAVISAQGLTGAQAISAKIVVGKPVTILLTGATYTFSGSDAVFEITSDSVSIIGSGRGESSLDSGPTQILLPSGNTSKHLIGADINLLQLKNLTFLGPGIDEPTGGGIDLELTGDGNVNGLIFENILVHNIAATGITIDVPIMSSFRNVRVTLCAVHGINIKGGTSINFDSVFVSTVVQSAIQMSNTSYSTFQNTAVETAGIGYNIKSSFNITLVSPGAESQLNRSAEFNGIAYKIDGGNYINLISPYSRDVPTTGSYHFVVEGAENVIITNPRIKQGTVTPTDDILVDSMSKNVELVTDIDASRIDDSGTNTLIRYGHEFNSLEVSGNIGVGVDGPIERVEVNGTVKATAFDGDGANVINLSVSESEIESAAVTNPKIATDAVDTAQIVNAAVTTDKINSAAVTETKIASDAVTTVKIADADVTEAKLATDSVTTAKITNANVTTDKLAASAVTTAKIADANVTTVKISDANVTTDKLATNAVTTVKITDANVTEDKLADSAVTTTKIADDSITTDKMAPSLSGVPVGGVVMSENANDANLIANGYSLLSSIEVSATDTWELISDENVPLTRAGHTAVWTGTKMIVWGGSTGGGETNSGGIYDPSTDTWISTFTPHAPEARKYHVAAWTGTEMIVWGGESVSSGNFGTGGLYDPQTLTWRSTAIDASAPTARERMLGVWIGDRFAIFGGRSASTPINTGAIYDPTAESWEAMSTVDAPYIENEVDTGVETAWAFWNGTEVVVLNIHGNIWRFDPAANSWEELGDTLDNGIRIVTSVLADTKILCYAFTGLNENSVNDEIVAIYDFVASQWTIHQSSRFVGGGASSVRASSVWTGSYFVTWGNSTPGVVFDPSSNLFRQISSTDQSLAPSIGFSMISTDFGVIIWGGGNNYSVGALYHPEKEKDSIFLYFKQ